MCYKCRQLDSQERGEKAGVRRVAQRIALNEQLGKPTEWLRQELGRLQDRVKKTEEYMNTFVCKDEK